MEIIFGSLHFVTTEFFMTFVLSMHEQICVLIWQWFDNNILLSNSNSNILLSISLSKYISKTFYCQMMNHMYHAKIAATPFSHQFWRLIRIHHGTKIKIIHSKYLRTIDGGMDGWMHGQADVSSKYINVGHRHHCYTHSSAGCCPLQMKLPTHIPDRPLDGHGPLARYVKLLVVHAPEMPGTFSPPPQFSDPEMHQGACVTHVPRCMRGSLTSDFLWSWWWG